MRMWVRHLFHREPETPEELGALYADAQQLLKYKGYKFQ